LLRKVGNIFLIRLRGRFRILFILDVNFIFELIISASGKCLRCPELQILL
jgi:hypothetical protein